MDRKLKLSLGIFFIIIPLLLILGIYLNLTSTLTSDLTIMYGGISWMISAIILYFFLSKKNKWIAIGLFIIGLLWLVLIVYGLNSEI